MVVEHVVLYAVALFLVVRTDGAGGRFQLSRWVGGSYGVGVVWSPRYSRAVVVLRMGNVGYVAARTCWYRYWKGQLLHKNVGCSLALCQ